MVWEDLLYRGFQPLIDQDHPNFSLCMIYTTSVGIMVVDEVAQVDDRIFLPYL